MRNTSPVATKKEQPSRETMRSTGSNTVVTPPPESEEMVAQDNDMQVYKMNEDDLIAYINRPESKKGKNKKKKHRKKEEAENKAEDSSSGHDVPDDVVSEPQKVEQSKMRSQSQVTNGVGKMTAPAPQPVTAKKRAPPDTLSF